MRSQPSKSAKSKAKKPKPKAVTLLSGGNPQIAKGDGEAPVLSYIEAMPEWKRAIGEQLDALIAELVPDVQKGVRWNSPFYGVEGRGWFLSFHVFTRYVRVTFFAGLSLKPVPPGGTEKSGEGRWIDIHEDEGIDEARMTKWIKQAAKLPGWQSSTTKTEPKPAPTKNPEVDAYLAKAKRWRDEQGELREILFGCGLTEELKWSKPCYTFDGHNVAIIQGFKDFCAVLFPNGALLKDPKGFLEKPGENTHSARRMPFRSLAEIAKRRTALKSFVKEAVKAEKAGREVEPRKEREPIPEELQRKMKSDPELKKAFEALTPGRQRGYILHISAAKQSTTRENRIEKWRPHILSGKGMHDR